MEKTIQYIFGDSASNLEAKFLPEIIELHYIDNKTKLKNTKYINYESFFSAVNRQTKLDTKLMAPGVRYMSRKDGFTYVLIEDVGRIQELTLHIKKRKKDGDDSIKIKVPVPPMLVGITLKEHSNIMDARVWALKEPIRSLQDMAYCFPLGNSYGEDGKFCWGTATDYLRNIKEMSQLRSVFSLIYGSAFNNDLDIRCSPTETMKEETMKDLNNLENFYRYLKGKKVFPYECLQKAGSIINCIRTLEDERGR